MSRTNIDLDDDACRAVMQRYQLDSKKDAVNFALRRLAAEPLDVDRARALRGLGLGWRPGGAPYGKVALILVDTSAWVEFLRNTGSPACVAVDSLLGEEIAVCDVVSMEVLAGARDERHLTDLRGLLARATTIALTPADYEHAAALYRHCRRNGETVRKLIDCLIGAVAIRVDASLLHADSDFATLARHSVLRAHASSNT